MQQLHEFLRRGKRFREFPDEVEVFGLVGEVHRRLHERLEEEVRRVRQLERAVEHIFLVYNRSEESEEQAVELARTRARESELVEAQRRGRLGLRDVAHVLQAQVKVVRKVRRKNAPRLVQEEAYVVEHVLRARRPGSPVCTLFTWSEIPGRLGLGGAITAKYSHTKKHAVLIQSYLAQKSEFSCHFLIGL